MQFFKNDALENKIYEATLKLFNVTNQAQDDMELGAYECAKMGELLYDTARMPLVNVIKREIFINCFKQIFEAWAHCGTFESYLTVFRKIFGEDATINFTVPAYGELEVDVEATTGQLFDGLVKIIETNEYVLYDLQDNEGENILFRTQFGIETQDELEKVVFSLVPNGVFTTVSLTIIT
jgi:hypothetical protein